MLMKIKYGNIDFFMSVDLSTWLSERSKTMDDVTDAIVLAKNEAIDDDGDAVFTADLTSGITKSSNNLLVEADETDFDAGKLEIGGEYKMYLGVKFTGDATYREITLSDWKLKCTQDGIRA